jgi:hypothetical protein
MLDVALLRTPVLETPLVDAFSIEMNQFHAAGHDLQRYRKYIFPEAWQVNMYKEDPMNVCRRIGTRGTEHALSCSFGGRGMEDISKLPGFGPGFWQSRA